MIYTFVKGANIPATVQVGDQHTWSQMRPHVGGYPGRPSGPNVEITGTVVAVEDLWVRVEAEVVPVGDWT